MSASTSLLGLRGFPPGGRLLWRAGAVFVASGMLTGAFGSHGLKKREGMTADKVSSFMTASHYAIFNGLGLMLVSAHPRFASHRFAGPAIALGGFIFSSSIWGLIVDRERFKFLGPITPMGGMLAIIGYLTLAF